MSLRHQETRIAHPGVAHYDAGAQGDVDSCTPNSSSDESNPSRTGRKYSSGTGSQRGSEGSCTKSEYEEYEEKCKNRTTTVNLISHASSPPKKPARKRSKARTCKAQNIAGSRVPLFPPIKPHEGPRQRIASARERCIKELSNQVWELQQQLRSASQENRLLQRLQGRHTVALQHFQDSQRGLPQVLQKHSNEVRALQELLRKACVRRNTLTHRLRGTEGELLHTRDALQHLQQLSQDHSLREREELAQHLSLLTVDLEKKNKRVQDLERNLKLSSSFLNRRLNTEMRKTTEARDLSTFLQEQINQLTQKIKVRERELEIHNIYSHRFSGYPKKGTKVTKSVQTDNLSPLPIEAPSCQLEMEHQSEEHLGSTRSWGCFGFDFADKERDQNDTEENISNDSEDIAKELTSEDSEEGSNDEPQLQFVKDFGAAEEAAKPLQGCVSEQAEPGESHLFLHTEPPTTNKALNVPLRTRRHYTFKETIQNLHRGKPAYGPLSHSLGGDPRKCMKSQGGAEHVGSSAYEPSFMTSPQPREGMVHSKKSSLMRELFGQAQIAEPVPEGQVVSQDQSSDLDRTSAHHLGYVSPVSQRHNKFIIFD